MKGTIYGIATLLLVLGFSGCGDSSSDTPKAGDASQRVIDSGNWDGGFGETYYEKPYNCKGNLFYYKLSCSHSGLNGGMFYIYEDGSTKIIRTDGRNESCYLQNIFEEKESFDTSDINATIYSSNSLSDTTWYDTSTKIYYDTEGYAYNGQMIGIVNNAFEALIQDNSAGGTQTIRLYSKFIEVELSK